VNFAASRRLAAAVEEPSQEARRSGVQEANRVNLDASRRLAATVEEPSQETRRSGVQEAKR